MDIVILIVSILLLGFLCLKNVPTLVGGILCSVLLLLFYGMDLYTGLLDTYMSGFVDFTKTWFLMFLLGALFGKVMDVSGAADSLARAVLNLVGEKRISLGVFIISALFITCGISVYLPAHRHQDVQTCKPLPRLHHRRLLARHKHRPRASLCRCH